MSRDALMRPWLVTLVCLALLIARLSGAHLHLCFDGKEAPVTFYLADQAPHHEGANAVVHHQDAEVSVAGDVIAKASKGFFDLPLFLLTALLLWSVFQPVFRFTPSADTFVRPIDLQYLRPPLRGPPLHTSP